jgi:16S rRNA (adenine(1408)-N(1))-methyltransferase
MLEQIIGKKSQPLDREGLLALAAPYTALHADLGTGDGMFVYRHARNRADVFYLGVDADRNSLAESSAKAAKKPARGGAANAAFVCFNLLDVPADVTGVADHVFVNFPWGSLMYAWVQPDVAAIRRMAAIGKSGADFSFYLNLYVFQNEEQRQHMNLPDVDEAYVTGTLIPAYAQAGITIRTHAFLDADALKDHPSTWAGRLIRRSGRATLYMTGTIA